MLFRDVQAEAFKSDACQWNLPSDRQQHGVARCRRAVVEFDDMGAIRPRFGRDARIRAERKHQVSGLQLQRSVTAPNLDPARTEDRGLAPDDPRADPL
jgi:hypothetical protein